MVEQDISVADFMRQYLADNKYEALRFTLKNYVQGYYAGDVEKASTHALCEELITGETVNYRVENGYQKLIEHLEEQCRSKGVEFYLSEEVKEIKWKITEVEVITKDQTFFGKKILVTVSIGVLQSETIRFSPALPKKIAAAKKLGFGHVVKINLQFREAFWKDKSFTAGKDLSAMNFLFSEQAVPTWWTQHPQKTDQLVGWLGGTPAIAFANKDMEEITQKAMESLAIIFSVDVLVLQQKLMGAEWYNWSADKHYCGAYSYNVVNGESLINTVLEPIDNTIYFAGEGLHHGNEMGTVEAALTSGRNVAHGLIAHFNS